LEDSKGITNSALLVIIKYKVTEFSLKDIPRIDSSN
jgi:hypothetical protein